MRPSMLMAANRPRPAEFVGAALQTIGASPGTINLGAIPGLQVGDYVFLFCSANSFVNPPDLPGWDRDNVVWGSGYRMTTYRRRIVSTANVTVLDLADAAVEVAAYRGATRAARRTVATTLGPNPTLSVPGVTRAGDSVGLLSMISDRDATTEDFTPSSGWTRRLLGTAGPGMRMSSADALPRASYTDGASMTWSGTSGGYRAAQLYELLR